MGQATKEIAHINGITSCSKNSAERRRLRVFIKKALCRHGISAELIGVVHCKGDFRAGGLGYAKELCMSNQIPP